MARAALLGLRVHCSSFIRLSYFRLCIAMALMRRRVQHPQCFRVDGRHALFAIFLHFSFGGVKFALHRDVVGERVFPLHRECTSMTKTRTQHDKYTKSGASPKIFPLALFFAPMPLLDSVGTPIDRIDFVPTAKPDGKSDGVGFASSREAARWPHRNQTTRPVKRP